MFLQSDPIGYGSGMNLYAYVGNDPVNSTDPSGMAVSYSCHQTSGNHCKPDYPKSDGIMDCNPLGCLWSPDIFVKGSRESRPSMAWEQFRNALGGGISGPGGDSGMLSGPGDGAQEGPENEREQSTPDRIKRCASAQFGLDDLAAGGAAVSGFNILETRGKPTGAIPGTSIASRGASAVLGRTRLPFRLPTIIGNPLTLSASIRFTSGAARIVGRGIPVVGWGLLAYDAAKIAQCVVTDG